MVMSMLSGPLQRCLKWQRFPIFNLFSNLKINRCPAFWLFCRGYYPECKRQKSRFVYLVVSVSSTIFTALGPVDPELDIASLGPLHINTIDKTLFSMLIPEIQEIFLTEKPLNVVLMGIEVRTLDRHYSRMVTRFQSHICILQTALALVSNRDIQVYVVADAVSSCNAFEVPLAFDTMRHAGIKVLTSESLGFLLMRDASLPTFKEFSRIIKESKESTKAAGDALLKSST